MLGTDVIWTAGVRGAGWLLDVSDFISKNGDKFIPSTVDTTEYEGKNWAVPFNSNAGFIYYRTDEVDTAPETWRPRDTQQGNGVVYQGFRYEGLTVNFLELVYSAGGSVLSEDGKEATPTRRRSRTSWTSWPRASRTARPEGRHDLQGGGSRGAHSSPATRRSCAPGSTRTRWARTPTSPTS